MAIVKSIVANLPKLINNILPTLIEGFTDLVLGITELLPTLLPLLVDGAMVLFVGIINGLNQVVALLLPMLPTIIQQICDTLIN